MTTSAPSIGGGTIYYYKPDTTTTISAPSVLVSSNVSDLTEAPDLSINGLSIEASTTYEIKLAYLGLDNDNGGLAVTTVSTAYNHTTGVNAVGIRIDVTIPSKALGVLVLIDGQVAAAFPQKPINRANGTQGTRSLGIYYRAVPDALLTAAITTKAAAATCYGMDRQTLPDTSDDTTFGQENKLVDITPAHSSDFNIVTGRNPNMTATFYNYDPDAIALVLGALKTTVNSEVFTSIGHRSSTVFRARPYEVHTPGNTANTNNVWFFMTAETESESPSIAHGKETKPAINITIKSVPDDITLGTHTVSNELYS